MVSRPELKADTNYLNGLAAVVLFVVLVAVFLTAGFDAPAGFEDGSLVAGIGYALMDLHAESVVPVEGFLMAFELVGVVLVAAVVAAVTLARHDTDENSGLVTALTDGGQPVDNEGEH